MAQTKSNKEVKDVFKQINSLMKPSGDQIIIENEPSLCDDQIKLQRKLLGQLSLWFKASEEKRKALNMRNKVLLKENADLRKSIVLEREKMDHILQKFKCYLDNHEKFVQMNGECRKCKTLKDQGGHSEDKETSVDLLPCPKDKVTQTSQSTECITCKLLNVKVNKKQLVVKEPSINLTKSKLSQLEEDIQELKEVLTRRDYRWTKIFQYGREQKSKVATMNAELSNLKNTADSQQIELQIKSRSLEMATDELLRTRKEVVLLRKRISKMENRD